MLIEKVELVSSETFYTRHGEWTVLITALLFGVVGIVLGRWGE
jgi:apolipoprotein N-acyltransferase